MLALGAACLASAAIAGQQRYVERVSVARILVDVRVVDPAGRPIRDLDATEFEVRLNGTPARIETVQWIDGAPARAPDAAPDGPDEAAGPPAAEPPGRLIVFLFQKSLEGGRIPGLMQLLRHARDFVETFTPADRVAVLSFDAHLRIWTDFTSDRERLRALFERRVLLESPGPVQESPPPSLVARLSGPEARRIYSIEKAMRLVGDALAPLPGAKSLVLVGHGFGHYGRNGVTMDPEYGAAAEALVAARVSVFCLDITKADYHSLEAGLQLVAQDTGGFFERTHQFSERAMNRLAGALAGHYVLFVDPGDRAWEDTRQRVDVSVARNGVTVMTSRTHAR
jgi:VWFA-related protein